MAQANELDMHGIGADISALHNIPRLRESIQKITLILKNFQKTKSNIAFEERLLSEIVKFNYKYFPSPEYKRKVRKDDIEESYESQIAELDSRIKGLESERTALANDLKQLTEGYNRLKTAVMMLAGAISFEGMGKRLGEELHTFLLKYSKVLHMIIDDVGKFIDFRKYLGLAAVKWGVRGQQICKTVFI